MVSGIIISFHEGLIRRSAKACLKMADDREIMKDVSHTAPHDTSAKGVWKRGRGPVEEEEEE
jgi:hypothetical protein